MCMHEQHTCTICKDLYPCALPNWSCSTMNDDEDADLCPTCLDKIGQDMQIWIDTSKPEPMN